MANTSVSGRETLQRFTIALEKFSDHLLPQQIKAFQKYIALKLFRLILQKTPVDTGALRGAWTVSIGNPSSGNAEKKLSPAGNQADALPEEIQQMQAMAAQLNAQPLGAKIWFCNTMPYVLRIEFGGHSKVKAPQGMVRVSLEEVISWAQSRPVFKVSSDKGE